MQTIEIYITVTCLIWVWVELVKTPLLTKQDKLGRYSYRSKWLEKLDRKPLNCGTCLSFWSGILLTICTGSIIFLTLPVSYKLIHKHI